VTTRLKYRCPGSGQTPSAVHVGPGGLLSGDCPGGCGYRRYIRVDGLLMIHYVALGEPHFGRDTAEDAGPPASTDAVSPDERARGTSQAADTTAEAARTLGLTPRPLP